MKKKHAIREEARICYGNLLNYTKFNLISNHFKYTESKKAKKNSYK